MGFMDDLEVWANERDAARVAVLNDQIKSLNDANLGLQSTVSTLQTDLSAAQAQASLDASTIANLREQLDECQKQQPTPTPTPDPAPEPPAPATVFGVSTPNMDALTKARADGFKAFRIFWQGAWPAKWADDPRLASAKPGEHFILSEHNATPAQTKAFAESIPAAMKPTVWLTHDHEPENDLPDTATPEEKAAYKAKFRAEQKQHHDVAKAAGVKFALILMGYTAEPNSGRDYKDWYVPGQCEAIFWDRYNSGNKKQPPIFTPVPNMIDDMIRIGRETGIPWGVTETGAKVNCVASNGYPERPAWAAAFAKALKDNGALYGIWWDQNNAGFDVRLDAATAAAWR